MPDHLPECPCTTFSDDEFCICDRLRACEARVRDEYESQDCYTLGFAHGINEGVPKALDAARDAVAALVTPCDGPCCDIGNALLNRVLAAIDALKGER